MPTISLSPRPPGTLAIAFALTFPVAHARADCIDDAAARHQVNTFVLRAIGWQESRLRPEAIGHNANGSVDLGAFQINSVHLPELSRHGIGSAALADGCVSAEVAAWHYRRQVDSLGDTWQAIGAYHSRTTARAAWYANQIAAILARWNLMPPGARPFPAERTLRPSRAPLPTASAAVSAIVPATPPSFDAPALAELASAPTTR